MKNIEIRGIRARKNFFLQKSSLMMNEKQRLTGHRDMKRNFCFFRSYRYRKAFIKQRETERRMTRDE